MIRLYDTFRLFFEFLIEDTLVSEQLRRLFAA